MKVSEIMTASPKTCTEDQTVEDAAKIMIDLGISVMLVVDGSGQLTGVVTESDFVGKEVKIPHALASIKQLFGQNFYFQDVETLYKETRTKKLKEVMTKNPKTIAPDATIDDLVRFMTSNRLKRVPVIDGGKLVGIVTRKDLLKAYLND